MMKIPASILRPALAVVAALVPTMTTWAEPPAPAPPVIKVENARVLAVPPVAEATAAFMVLVNPGDRPVRLIGFTSPIAGGTAPMITTQETRDGRTVLGMATVPTLEVPARGRRELKPGGDHLMLMSLKGTPKEGETVSLTLRFEQPGPAEMTLQAPVVRDASAPAAHTH